MKPKYLQKILTGIFTFLLIIGLGSCTDDTTPGLNDNPVVSGKDRPVPVITSVEPASGLAGVTIITINGENFSNDAEMNIVYFDDQFAEILEASANKLVVKAPILIKDGIKLRVSWQDGAEFSNTIEYNLSAPVVQVLDLTDIEDPYSLAMDGNDNLYVSLVKANASAGVWKLTPDGSFSEFGKAGGETFYNDLKFINDNGTPKIYGARNVRAIFEILEGQSPVAKPVSQTSSKFVAIDFDENLNLWAAGEGGNIWRYNFSTDPIDTKEFPFEPKVSSMKIYNNHIYVAAETATEAGVWKIPIVSADELGAAEKIFTFSDYFTLGSDKMNAIAISQGGDVFLGTNTDEEILLVKADGTYTEWYPGLITGPVVNMTWGNDNYLYYTSRKIADVQQQLIYKINMERPGAPYYGRQ